MAGNNKVSQVEKEMRIAVIMEKMLEGYTHLAVLKWVRANTSWGLSDNQIRRYIALAEDYIKVEAAKLGKAQIGKAMMRLELLFMKNFEQERWRDALEVQKEINKVINIYAAERDGEDPKDTNITIKFISPDDLKKD